MFLIRVKRKVRGGVGEQLSKKLHPWKKGLFYSQEWYPMLVFHFF